MNRRLLIAYGIVLVALAAAAAALDRTKSAFNIHVEKAPVYPESGLTFGSLPTRAEGWERLGSDPPPMSKEMLESLGTENYISRTYVERDVPEGESPEAFELHCAYYTGMIDTVPHVPERCFVGGGNLSIDGSAGEVVRVPLDLERFPPDPTIDEQRHGEIRRGRTSRFSDAPGVRVRTPRGLENLKMNVTGFVDERGRRFFSGYFFIANGGTVARADDVRLLAFRRDAEHAYYAKVQFTSTTVESAEELAAVAGDFLNEMFPEIMRRVPDWVDVVEGRVGGPASGAPATN